MCKIVVSCLKQDGELPFDTPDINSCWNFTQPFCLKFSPRKLSGGGRGSVGLGLDPRQRNAAQGQQDLQPRPGLTGRLVGWGGG